MNHARLILCTSVALLAAGCADSRFTSTQPISVTLGSPSIEETAGDDVTFTVSYDGVDAVVLSEAHVQVVATGTATATASVAGDGATRTVTLTNISGDGTISVTLAAGSAQSTTGMPAPEAVADWSVVIDNTPPTVATAIAPTGTLAITVSGESGDVPLTWNPASDAGTAVVRYEVAIGSTPGASDVRAFTDVGAVSSYTATGLTLSTGVDYWFAVRAVDRCGNVGAVGVAPVWHPGLCGVTTSAVGSYPIAVAVGDFDADGDQDLAVSCYLASAIYVLLNDGRGSFTPLTPHTIGTIPGDVAAADVNADGVLDLVVCHANAAAVGVHLGNGDGTFGTAQTFATAQSPWWLRVVDCDGIQGPDLVVGCAYQDTVVSVLLNNGDGSFALRVDHQVNQYTSIVGFEVEDLDGDADVDIAIGHGSYVSILRNAGNGTFAAPTDYAVGGAVYAMTVADIDGDGKPDVPVTTAGSLIVFQATGAGDPAAFTALPAVALLPNPRAITAGDIDADGDIDLIVVERNGLNGRVQFLSNDGSGGLTRTDLTASSNGYRCVASRLNGNSFLDVVVADLNQSRVTLILDPAAGCVF